MIALPAKTRIWIAVYPAVRDTVARLIADLYAGKLHPRVAAGLAALLNLQLRAIEVADLDHRLTKLEKLVAEVEGSSNGRGATPQLDIGDLPVPQALKTRLGAWLLGWPEIK